jgi:hypothetical protein
MATTRTRCIFDESWGLDNVRVSIPEYCEDFEGTVDLASWSEGSTSSTPRGARGFLGQFSEDDSTELTLTGLPAHSGLRISFDVFVIRSWDGNGQGSSFPGPDRWKLTIDDVEMLDTTFANAGPSGPVQSYPDDYRASNVPRTGARENNTLGYFHARADRNAVYHMEYDVTHSAENLSLVFESEGLQDLDDESWGLDNVVVTVADVTSPDFIRGDASGDGVFHGLLDATVILMYQFANGARPPCLEAADADGNGVFIGILDALYVLEHQFTMGPPPPAPYPDCSGDPDVSTTLGCLRPSCP